MKKILKLYIPRSEDYSKIVGLIHETYVCYNSKLSWTSIIEEESMYVVSFSYEAHIDLKKFCRNYSLIFGRTFSTNWTNGHWTDRYQL